MRPNPDVPLSEKEHDQVSLGLQLPQANSAKYFQMHLDWHVNKK